MKSIIKIKMGKINRELIEKGMEEILNVKISNLEAFMESSSISVIQVGFDEYMMAMNLAKSFGIDTEKYQERIDLKKLKKYGIKTE